MNVLILHGFADLALARNTSRNHIFCYQRYVPEHEYIYHCAYDPITPALRSAPFAAIVLDTSFLSQRTLRPRVLFNDLKERWAWLAESPAVKLALPQDEYDEYLTLDDWLCELDVDVIYGSVGYPDFLYPQASRDRKFVDCLTGYIDDSECEIYRRRSKPMSQRRRVIGYRGRDLGPQYGRTGQLKRRIHEAFTAAGSNSEIVIDSMVSPDGAILGDAWVDFLCDCRFVPCGPSGVSMSDPRGEIRDAVEDYIARHPDADYEEIERNCFPGQDQRRQFTTIPPRMFEAAAAGACQIQVEGRHLHMLEPEIHYIPLRPDFSNIEMVMDRLSDLDEASRIAERCYDRLFSSDEFRYSRFARELMGTAESVAALRGVSTSRDPSFSAQRKTHERQLATAKADIAAREARAALRSKIVGNLASRFGGPLKKHLPTPVVDALRRILAK